MSMEPISAFTTALSLTKSAAELSKKLYEFGKSLKDREQKRQVEEMQDTLTEFKREASQLEDQNRELRERLRFKSDYIFRSPFQYHKDRPDEPLCVKCFAKGVIAQLSEPGWGGVNPQFRQCLVCDEHSAIDNSAFRH
jgi:hypothetical protein